MKVIINATYGGYGLSEKAYELLANKHGVPIVMYDNDKHRDQQVIFDRELSPKDDASAAMTRLGGRYWDSWTSDDENRSDSRIVDVVEELGEEASGKFSELKIVEVPDDVKWVIEEYDGYEHVAEKHETWS